MDKTVGASRPRGLRWVFLLVAALLVSVMIPTMASAGGGDRGKHRIALPQQKNAPLWNTNGGSTRLQKCFPLTHDLVELDAWAVENGYAGIAGMKLNATYVLENWTGTGLGPVSTNQNRSIVIKGEFRKHHGADVVSSDGLRIKAWLCFSADWTSQKAGLAVIKGTFSGPALEGVLQYSYRGIEGYLGMNENEVLDQHQWLAGWLQLMTPELVNEPADSPNPDGITKDKFPKGEIPHMAGKSGYDYRVRVKFLLPLGDKKGSFGKDVATLPDDFEALAKAFAIDGSDPWCSVPGVCYGAWDIHDDWFLPASKKDDTIDHANEHSSYKCRGEAEPSHVNGYEPGPDVVDNCRGGYDFSHMYGMTRGFAVGPFDETRPRETWLPDGKVDAGDFAAPAVEIQASILPATKEKPLGGAGYLSPVYKEDVYSQDKNGNGKWYSCYDYEIPVDADQAVIDGKRHKKCKADPHELYAPFYSQNIPATSRGPLSSGTTGVSNPNNFYGFKTYGVYHNWEFADKVWTHYTKTECVQQYGHNTYGDIETESEKQTIRPKLRPAPYGVQKAIVYTDEHGEAWFHWNPGRGFNFLSIPGVFVDDNGACDLQGKPILGQSDIQVEAVYPYQPVFGEPRYISDTDKKSILNGFNKALYYEQKNTNEGPNGWHVTAWYTEIDGNGPGHKRHRYDGGNSYSTISDVTADGKRHGMERVCFATSDNGLINVLPEQAGKLTRVEGYKGWVCVRMAPGYKDDNGNRSPALATVTVRSTDGNAVKVFADFVDERIKRMITVGGKTGGTAPPEGGKVDGTAPKGAGTSAPTAAALKAAGVASPQVATRALKVKKAKFKKVKAHGKIKRGIVFAKFVSPTKKVKATVQLMGFKNGQLSVLKTFKVTKKANTKKMIRVKVIKNKKLVKRVKSVRVTPIRAVGKPFAA